MPSTKNVDALAQIKEDLADVQAVWVSIIVALPLRKHRSFVAISVKLVRS